MSSAWRFGATFRRAYGERDRVPSQGERWSYQCPYCAADPHALVLLKCMTQPNEFISLPAVGMQLYTLIMQCTRCEGVAMALWPFGEPRPGSQLTADPLIFPFPQVVSELLGGDDEFVPDPILEDLRQADLAWRAGAANGAGLLLRRALQYICRDKGCTGSNLKEEIDALAPQYVATDMTQLAHSIRIVGNELAHPDPQNAVTITEEDVSTCWEFVIQLIRVIYITPRQSDALQERLGKQRR